MSQEKKSLIRRLNPAGWLAVTVFGILLIGLVGLGARSVFGVNRLEPLATSAPTAVGNADTAEELATATVTAQPTPDPDEAWATFMEAIYKCDALEDVGDDLGDYPESLDELTDGIEDLTQDQEWIEWCRHDPCESMVCHIRRLVEFGPQNLECQDTMCQASVSVQSQGALYFMEDPPRQIVRPPTFTDRVPLRLIKAQLEYQPEEDAWIITDIETIALPESPESPACDDCGS